MNYRSLILSMLLMLFSTSIVLSQKSPAKFGKIEKKDLAITSCPIDKNAHAYFIFDIGASKFIYSENQAQNNTGQWRLSFKRHYRIKILNNAASDLANIEIPLYKNVQYFEEVKSFKGYVYNLENGKIIKTKISSKNLMQEETNQYWDVVKIALPNVKAGSVIEISYGVLSDFWTNFQAWKFQYDIPVLQSEYYTFIPQYFHYKNNIKGYVPIDVENKTVTRTIKHSINAYKRPGEVSFKYQASQETIEYIEYTTSFKGRNIPAIRKESFVKSIDNYSSEV